MNVQNPSIVTDAIIETNKKFGNIEIYPLSIFRYAYLEKVKSPFLNLSEDFSLENLAPSIFVMSKDKDVLKKYAHDIDALKEDALDFIDENADLETITNIISEISAKLTQLNKAAPSDSNVDTKETKKGKKS